MTRGLSYGVYVVTDWQGLIAVYTNMDDLKEGLRLLIRHNPDIALKVQCAETNHHHNQFDKCITTVDVAKLLQLF